MRREWRKWRRGEEERRDWEGIWTNKLVDVSSRIEI